MSNPFEEEFSKGNFEMPQQINFNEEVGGPQF